MSKSLGNFFTIREVLKLYSGEEIRLFVLGSHYRSPLNYATSQLDAARSALRRFYTALNSHEQASTAPIASDDNAIDDHFLTTFKKRVRATFGRHAQGLGCAPWSVAS